MNDHSATSLDRINELWALHKAQAPEVESDGRCLAFLVGRRYLPSITDDAVEYRIGVSFGRNPFTPDSATEFFDYPAPASDFVFGLHMIGTRGDQITIYWPWIAAREAGEFADTAEALRAARSMLESMPDEEYDRCVRDDDDDAPLKTSEQPLFESFEVLGEYAF